MKHGQDLQSIANNKSGGGANPFQIIGAIIFFIPIIIHAFKWGWIYPILAIIVEPVFTELIGNNSLAFWLWVLFFIGSIILFISRVRKMWRRRKAANQATINPSTPVSMRDYD